jgi:hypothetical protein
MPAIAAQPFLMTDVSLTIGTDTYEAACTKVLLVPNVPVVKWRGLTPSSRFTFVKDPEWTAQIQFAQDFASASSLSKYLHTTPPGTKVAFTFDPIAGGATITAEILVIPAQIGGDIDTVPEAPVTFEVVGQPTIDV